VIFLKRNRRKGTVAQPYLSLDEQEDNRLFSASKGSFSCRIVVVYQNRAYRLSMPNKYIDEIYVLLSDVFSQKVI
jgi:hypothetical protein